MQFENNLIYHVYNQGNNRQPVFFKLENYLFFLRKMRKHIMPHAHFLCYCLMPNHFHWLLQVHITFCPAHIFCNEAKPGRRPISLEEPARSLNDSIAVLLRSYTRAINKQEDRSGALFRPKTKAKSGWIDEFIMVDRYRKGPGDFRAFPDDDYGWECFRYIHENPVKAGLCSRPEDWEFSSARDYAGIRAGSICNQELARNLLGLAR